MYKELKGKSEEVSLIAWILCMFFAAIVVMYMAFMASWKTLELFGLVVTV